MKILIPGGTGLLGSALCKYLVEHGHAVWVLSRNPSTVADRAGVRFVGWDGRTASGWVSVVNEVDAIINLAGENIGAGRWTKERKARIRESRVLAGKAIVDAIQLATHRPDILVQASGIGAYGPRHDEVVDETSSYGSDFTASVAVDWEASTQPIERMGVRRVVIRTGLVMTSSGGWMSPLLLPYKLFVGGPMGDGKQWWSWIHLRDYIGAVLHLLELPNASGVYNLTAPNPCQMKDFGRTLAKVLGRPYWFPVPAFGLKLVLGEMSTLILDGQRAVPKRLLESGYRFSFSELEPALRDLFG